jgi:hypothetical protein
MTIKDELLDLQKRHKILRPETAVEWARVHPQSALHASLEWDDSAAANEFRIWQIRRLIAVHIISETGVRQMVSLTIDRSNAGGGYRALDDVLASQTMQEVLLADALAELERVRAKYESLVELASIWAEVNRAKTKQAKRSGSKLRQERSRAAAQA